MARLDSDYTIYCQQTNKLSDLHANINPLPPKYQKVVAEIVLLRMFDLLINTIVTVVAKVSSGAIYLDGTRPHVILQARTKAEALQNMKIYNRQKPRILKWSKVTEIKKNLEHVLNSSDNILTVLDAHGIFIDEVRRVRNRITHNNESARKQYKVIVRRHYGAYVNSITPGTLLLSPRRSPTLMEEYLRKSKLFVKQMARA